MSSNPSSPVRLSRSNLSPLAGPSSPSSFASSTSLTTEPQPPLQPNSPITTTTENISAEKTGAELRLTPIPASEICLNPTLTRHADLWFEDGSVVCRAENTLFRVHMSQLARHSVCFKDMFSMPQPQLRLGCDDTSLEKTPLILHDTAEDVGNLFTALYDGPYVMSAYCS